MYAIKTRSGFLYAFWPNGLPVGRKSERLDGHNGYFPVLKLSEIVLQSGGKIIFHGADEAHDYIGYVRSEILANSERYEEARPGSTAELLKLVDTFFVKDVKEAIIKDSHQSEEEM